MPEKGCIITIRELYMIIGGDYESALNVLRVEKLVDKHIRRFPKSDVAQRLFAAVESMDATEGIRLYEVSGE